MKNYDHQFISLLTRIPDLRSVRTIKLQYRVYIIDWVNLVSNLIIIL